MNSKLETLRTGFLVTSSSEGKGAITIHFPDIATMHKAHDELIALASESTVAYPTLDKAAQVGAVRFHAGVSSKLVVEAAQRNFEYQDTPENEAARIERAKLLKGLIEQPMSDQDARFAIDGAINWGYEGTHKPPTEDHWLMPYWVIGRKLANDVPVSWQLVPKEPDINMMEAALVIGRKWAKFQYLENDDETENFAKAVALDIVSGYRAMLDVAPTLVVAESEG
jgi:hypothetical protein